MLNLNNQWENLHRPKDAVIEESLNKAKIIVEPLERGYGTTLGNALRRILLSSIHGSAPIGIKIPGIEHEFTSIPGVKEDVVDIILNIKNLVFELFENTKEIVKINVKNGGVVLGKDITVSENKVRVVSTDTYICTVEEGVEFSMEICVGLGLGYVQSEKIEAVPTGFLAIDACYSPIVNVMFEVDNSRIQQVTDYDKLTLEVTTDGSVNARTTIMIASRILQTQLNVFSSCVDDITEVQSISSLTQNENSDEVNELDKNLLIRIEELDLSVRSQNCLKAENIVYVGDLLSLSEHKMLATPNFGRKSLSEIKEVLNSMGYDFGMTIPNWPPQNIDKYLTKFKESEEESDA